MKQPFPRCRRLHWLGALACSLLLMVPGGILAAEPEAVAPPSRWQAERILAFGDVHGAYEELVQLLQGNGVIDAELRWAAGTTHLVSVGDLIDRGAHSRRVLDLLRRLQHEAAAAGGRVHLLLGNHEAMNLQGDLRFVSDPEFAAFARDPLPPAPDAADAAAEEATDATPPGFLQYQYAFSPAGEYGQWLTEFPAWVVINDTLFVHGGLPVEAATTGLAEVNAAIAAVLGTPLPDQEPGSPGERLLGDDGPLWYRGTALCHPLLERRSVQQSLAALGASRVVLGHTPTAVRRVSARFDDQVWAIDTGMLRAVYRGTPFLWELPAAGPPRVTNVRGETVEPQRAPPPLLVPAAAEQELAAEVAAAVLRPVAGARGEVEVSLTGRVLRGSFVAAKPRAVRNATAAWRLDRTLGVLMVPLTVAHSLDGRAGYAQFSQGRWMTETQRSERNLQRPNHCARGHAYQLVAAFNALLGVELTAEALSYHTSSWAIRLTDQRTAFPVTRALPSTGSDSPLPEGMARALRELTGERAASVLGPDFSRRELQALERRRTAVLGWEPVE